MTRRPLTLSQKINIFCVVVWVGMFSLATVLPPIAFLIVPAICLALSLVVRRLETRNR